MVLLERAPRWSNLAILSEVGPVMLRETTTIDGRSVHYLHAGDVRAARTLVLIHGFPLGAAMWEPQLRNLAVPPDARGSTGWRVLAPSLPGYDGSDRVPRPSMTEYARHVMAFLDDRHVDTAVVAGLSMGGYVTFALLREAAHRVSAVILADTRAGADSEQGKAGRLATIELAERQGAAAVADDLIPKLFGSTSQRERPQVIATVRAMIARQTTDVIVDSARAMMAREDAFSLLRRLRLPTLIVVGEEDTLTSPEESERMHAAVAGSSLVRVRAAGHMSNLEHATAFNDAVRRFLATLLE